MDAIDWASRPYGKNSFTRKPSAGIGTSPGKIGTAVAQGTADFELRQAPDGWTLPFRVKDGGKSFIVLAHDDPLQHTGEPPVSESQVRCHRVELRAER